MAGERKEFDSTVNFKKALGLLGIEKDYVAFAAECLALKQQIEAAPNLPNSDKKMMLDAIPDPSGSDGANLRNAARDYLKEYELQQVIRANCKTAIQKTLEYLSKNLIEVIKDETTKDQLLALKIKKEVVLDDRALKNCMSALVDITTIKAGSRLRQELEKAFVGIKGGYTTYISDTLTGFRSEVRRVDARTRELVSDCHDAFEILQKQLAGPKALFENSQKPKPANTFNPANFSNSKSPIVIRNVTVGDQKIVLNDYAKVVNLLRQIMMDEKGQCKALWKSRDNSPGLWANNVASTPKTIENIMKKLKSSSLEAKKILEDLPHDVNEAKKKGEEVKPGKVDKHAKEKNKKPRYHLYEVLNEVFAEVKPNSAGDLYKNLIDKIQEKIPGALTGIQEVQVYLNEKAKADAKADNQPAPRRPS